VLIAGKKKKVKEKRNLLWFNE